ncbi:hypothetical protein [Pseudomonas vanderleydeniana]|uniref:Uncharacterized protein n=1 Tax=Pseudomonas vanderleydeniana TaxID=2745495 RepID=A0A9E6TPX7_9PSED|nr:hypothetical protein [Pseudomonas vanderleydeniana]QXI26309.1 hypothetical protein HU752_020440 [Pseudomonas vanderleydeniana]
MPQRKKPRVGEVMEYAIAITALVWDTVLLDPADRRRSTYESRLRGLFQAVAKAHNQSPQARQVHFDLCSREQKEGALALTLRRMEPPQGVPYLLLSLQGEPVEA